MSDHSPLEIARSYLKRGWVPLPVPYRSKNPGFPSWQQFGVSDEQLTQHFNGQPQNIGVLLGANSNDLVDIDLDCDESISIAPSVLPQTSAIFGRESRPRSHWLYIGKLKTEKFIDPLRANPQDKTDKKKAMICELRSSGAQTIFPGSTHDSGELITWFATGEPLVIDANQLRISVGRLAAASLLARYWPNGSRHEASLALIGGLMRAGWTESETAHFVEAICRAANDEETSARLRNIISTSARIESGSEAIGFPRLAQLTDARIVDKVRDWLNILTVSQWAAYHEHGNAAQADDRPNVHGYFLKDGYLTRIKAIRGGSVDVPLCNFDARIISDIVEDDGSAKRRVYELRGRLAGKGSDSTATVSADEFPSLRWIDGLLGASATVYARQHEHVRCAVKLLSEEIEEKHVYMHTGWREISGRWNYLHGGGAIGGESNCASVAVRLPDSLAAFVLPDPPQGADLVCAVKRLLNALAVATPVVTFPLLGAVWAAIIGGCDFSIHLAGDTGAGKSELAALAQAHFGGGFDREHLPGAWVSTGNSLERLAHAAKDAVLVVDDFAPTGTAADTARTHREADRLLRAQGNHAGRLRLRSDITFNAARAPRGLIVSTGEDIPRGASLRARMWVLEVEKGRGGRTGTVDFAVLTECQRHARAGVYASVTAAFVQWLSPNYKRVTEQAREELADLRNEFAAKSEGHKRHATTAAKLMRAWNLFLDFAASQGAISDDEREHFTRQAWEALADVAGRQEEHQASQDPAARFVELITAALSTGAAHIACDVDGRRPKTDLMALGWRDDVAQGKRIGWTDGINVYLEPDTAYAIANELGGKTGASIAVTPTTLWKRLHERGLLIREETRESLKKRHNIEGRRKSVIALRSKHILGGGDISQKPDQPDQLDSPDSETWATVRFNE